MEFGLDFDLFTVQIEQGQLKRGSRNKTNTNMGKENPNKVPHGISHITIQVTSRGNEAFNTPDRFKCF
jgi:hypothetical protein